jgi:hypothetical protein
MDERTPSPVDQETSQMPRARYGIEAALADIKRVHEELQSQKLRSQEIQRPRPVWKSFALGFSIGSLFFAAAIAGVWLLG